MIYIYIFFLRFIFAIFAFIIIGQIRADRKWSGSENGKGPWVGIRTVHKAKTD